MYMKRKKAFVILVGFAATALFISCGKTEVYNTPHKCGEYELKSFKKVFFEEGSTIKSASKEFSDFSVYKRGSEFSSDIPVVFNGQELKMTVYYNQDEEVYKCEIGFQFDETSSGQFNTMEVDKKFNEYLDAFISRNSYDSTIRTYVEQISYQDRSEAERQDICRTLYDEKMSKYEPLFLELCGKIEEEYGTFDSDSFLIEDYSLAMSLEEYLDGRSEEWKKVIDEYINGEPNGSAFGTMTTTSHSTTTTTSAVNSNRSLDIDAGSSYRIKTKKTDNYVITCTEGTNGFVISYANARDKSVY